jgi:hypothetical protein
MKCTHRLNGSHIVEGTQHLSARMFVTRKSLVTRKYEPFQHMCIRLHMPYERNSNNTT